MSRDFGQSMAEPLHCWKIEAPICLNYDPFILFILPNANKQNIRKPSLDQMFQYFTLKVVKAEVDRVAS